MEITNPTTEARQMGVARRVHLVGVCGAGMKALAEVLSDRGDSVSGCDNDPDPRVVAALERLGIEVQTGHHADHVRQAPDLLIYSAAVPPSNDDRREAVALRIPQHSYVDALAELSRQGAGIAIAGTHGKSTTTAMLAEILESAGRSPTVVCGAESMRRGRSGWAGPGPHVVLEACEYRRHFLNLSANLACVLGIEPDHFDCYPTLEDAAGAYQEFVSRVPASGVVVHRADCRVTAKVVHGCAARSVSFTATDGGADWKARAIRPDGAEMSFRIESPAGRSPSIRLNIPGRHNVLNALAAAACAGELGLATDEIVAGLESFRGLKRRLEYRGERSGATVVDDYAHHPTEIRAAIQAVRELAPGRPLWCIFEPHQTSRTAALLEEFVAALSLADRVYLLPVHAARENPKTEQVILSQSLATRLPGRAKFIPSLDRVWETVQTGADCAPVILTLGAGKLSRIHHERAG